MWSHLGQGVSEYDLWCNLKYLSLEKLLVEQPEGWLEVMPYHAEAGKVIVYWDNGGCWLQIEAKRVKEVDYYTGLKVLRAFKKKLRAQMKSVEEDIDGLIEYFQ